MVKTFKKEKDLNYFLGRTEPNGDCLEWTGPLDKDGYGRTPIKKQWNGRCHREVFFLTKGFYPRVVRHTCDNPKCINPDHLIPGDNLDNIKDRHERKRTGNYVSQEDIDNVKELRSQGLTYLGIALRLGIGRRRVEYILAVKKSGV